MHTQKILSDTLSQYYGEKERYVDRRIHKQVAGPYCNKILRLKSYVRSKI